MLEKHNITYIMLHDKLISPKGALTLSMEYDYVHQHTAFSYNPVNKKHNIKDYEEIISKTDFLFNNRLGQYRRRILLHYARYK